MAKHATVDDYIAAQPTELQPILHAVRAAIRKAVPKAGESISYQMPTYKLKGAALIYFAGWKKHFSLYPAGDRLVEAFEKELAPRKISKGTIQFRLSEPVPEKLIARIAKFRAKEIAARASGE